VTLEEILSSWDEDSSIEPGEYASESIRNIKLHSKYLKILSRERLSMIDLKDKLSILRLEKLEHYTNPSKETAREKGWAIPPQGAILKKEAPSYVENDPDVVKLRQRLALQEEKVQALLSIMDGVKSMGFAINRSIEWQKFVAGV